MWVLALSGFTMYPLNIISLAFLLTLAGCSAVPFGEPTPQKEPAPVKLVNNETLTETFEVSVVEVGKNITVYWGGNKSENIPVSSGSATLESPLSRVELPESARKHGQYTLEPGDRKQLSIENVSPDEAIVISVYDEPEGRYRSINSLSCSGPILGYKVETKSGGSDGWTPSTH